MVFFSNGRIVALPYLKPYCDPVGHALGGLRLEVSGVSRERKAGNIIGKVTVL